MEPDVRARLVEICAEKRGVSIEEASRWMAQMIEDERYMLDVWVG